MKKMTHHRLLGVMSSASGTAAFVCAALFFSVRVATAEPRLERPISDAIFIVGATCLDRNELARDLAARLGRDEIDRGIHVFVIETREEGLAFFITTATSIAPRVLPINPGEPCKDRRTAIAIALEDALRHAVIIQEKQPQQAPIKLPQPAPAALARAAPPVPPRYPIKISVTLRGLALFGVLNKPLRGGEPVSSVSAS